MYIRHHHPEHPSREAQVAQVTDLLRVCIGKLNQIRLTLGAR